MGKIGVGSLKPNKVKVRKVHGDNIGIIPAGTSKLDAVNTKVPIKNNV